MIPGDRWEGCPDCPDEVGCKEDRFRFIAGAPWRIDTAPRCPACGEVLHRVSINNDWHECTVHGLASWRRVGDVLRGVGND